MIIIDTASLNDISTFDFYKFLEKADLNEKEILDKLKSFGVECFYLEDDKWTVINL